MKRINLFIAGLLWCAATLAQDHPPRPKILGIASVHIYSTNIAAARDFYSKVLRPSDTCIWCEDIPRSPIMMPLNGEQIVLLTSSPVPTPTNLLPEIIFTTDDIETMKRFLTSKKIPFSAPQGTQEGPITFSDPEGHHIAFMRQFQASPKSALSTSTLRLIHAGFIVHDRAAAEHFYRDILGFRPYWHGGMKDDQTDWVSMQVPDGTDWVEFMVNVSPHADQRLRGIMNHIAIGVADIHATQQKLIGSGAKLTEEPKLGRDGKWQLNLYDPDDTRIEFMEFTPKEKPCCSEFTGPHPGPKQ
jgi:catechol 2,3-dioxygenase-like lactoylglutathione lyase family enzyme